MEENIFHVSFTVELFIRQIDRKLLAAMSVSDVTLIDVGFVASLIREVMRKTFWAELSVGL